MKTLHVLSGGALFDARLYGLRMVNRVTGKTGMTQFEISFDRMIPLDLP